MQMTAPSVIPPPLGVSLGGLPPPIAPGLGNVPLLQGVLRAPPTAHVVPPRGNSSVSGSTAKAAAKAPPPCGIAPGQPCIVYVGRISAEVLRETHFEDIS